MQEARGLLLDVPFTKDTLLVHGYTMLQCMENCAMQDDVRQVLLIGV